MTLDKADYYEVKALALAVSVAELEREVAERKAIAGNDATCEMVDATA
jgi:hypothetical protein